MSKELKPCPFCGGEDVEHLPDGFGNWLVGCVTCDYRIQCVSCTEDEAVRYWNTRPAEQYLKKRSDIYKATVFNLKREIKEYKSKILINGCHTFDELELYKILEKLLTTISFTWDEKGERGRE